MAEDNEESEGQEQSEAKETGGSGKKKLIILIVIGVLVISASVGGTLFLLGFFGGGEDEEAQEENAEEQVEEVIEKPKPAMYFPIKPPFIVNFQARGRQRFLQAEVTVMTRDMDIFNAMQTHAPLIKNRIVMLMSGEVYQELQTDEGKELLRQKVQQALQEIMQQEVGKEGVEEVLFTGFVMQ